MGCCGVVESSSDEGVAKTRKTAWQGILTNTTQIIPRRGIEGRQSGNSGLTFSEWNQKPCKMAIFDTRHFSTFKGRRRHAA